MPSKLHQFFIIALLGFAAYAPTLRVGFLWDDHVIIENNPAITEWSWKNLKNDFLTDNTRGTGDNYYRPLQAISHRIDYSIWGLRPFGYHLTNLLFHIGNGLLLQRLCLAMGLSPMAGLLAALLFVVHPVGVEQFIIPSGRGTPMSFFFALATLILLLRRTRRATIAGCLTFTMALFLKEYSLVVPMLYALLLWWKGERPSSRWIFPALVGLSIIYLAARRLAVGEITGEISMGLLARFGLHAFPKVLVHYVELCLWPWNLHSHRLLTATPLWPLYLVGGVGVAFWMWKRKQRLLLFSLGWLLLNLAPTIPQIIRGGFILDHWGYPLLPAIILPLSVFFADRWSGVNASTVSRVVACLLFPLLILWALIVHLNVALRGTDEKMYKWALHFTTSSPIHYNLGVLLLQSGRPAEAMEHFVAVHRLYPENSANTHAMAQTLWLVGDRSIAIKTLEALVKRDPAFLPAQQTLAAMKKDRRQK